MQVQMVVVPLDPESAPAGLMPLPILFGGQQNGGIVTSMAFILGCNPAEVSNQFLTRNSVRSGLMKQAEHH